MQEDNKTTNSSFNTELTEMMEVNCKNFQREVKLENVLESHLQRVDDTARILIQTAFGEHTWNTEIEVKCQYPTKIAMELQELFPTSEVEIKLRKCIVNIEGVLD